MSQQYSQDQMTKQSEFGRQRQANALEFSKDILIRFCRSQFQLMPQQYSLAHVPRQSEFGRQREANASEFSKDILIMFGRS